MLNFRLINFNEDLEEILDLLNTNFPSLHSRENFVWKHLENPFGQSYGLLAVDKGKIVALRLFMRWEFIKGKRTILAIRPVDTCTDRAYRGRGIFKKITLMGIESIKDEYDLVFNTPNKLSEPGYLKMGWESVNGPFQYGIGYKFPLGKVLNFTNISAEQISIDIPHEVEEIQTKVSTEFLKWRYSNKKYSISRFDDGGLLIYKLLRKKGISTLIIYEIIGDKTRFSIYLRSIVVANKVLAVYYLQGGQIGHHLNFLFSFPKNSQLVVANMDKLGIANEIKFSLGDLESIL